MTAWNSIGFILFMVTIGIALWGLTGRERVEVEDSSPAIFESDGTNELLPK